VNSRTPAGKKKKKASWVIGSGQPKKNKKKQARPGPQTHE